MVPLIVPHTTMSLKRGILLVAMFFAGEVYFSYNINKLYNIFCVVLYAVYEKFLERSIKYNFQKTVGQCIYVKIII